MFQDTIMSMWEALTTHNKNLAKNILADSLAWALENNYTTLQDLENVYHRL